MKRVLTIIALLCVNLAIAQVHTSNFVTRKDGKLLLMKSGNGSIQVGEPIRVVGGTIATDGTFTRTDGTKVMIEEGDIVYIDGKTEIKSEEASRKPATKSAKQ